MLIAKTQQYDILGQWWTESSTRRKKGVAYGLRVADSSVVTVASKPKAASKSLMESFLTVLAPFSYPLWGLIILLVFLSSTLMWWLEKDYNHVDLDKGQHWALSLLQAFYLGLIALLGQGTGQPVSAMGKLYSVGFYFFVLVVVAAYTGDPSAPPSSQCSAPNYALNTSPNTLDGSERHPLLH